jgi:hypothetical protein
MRGVTHSNDSDTVRMPSLHHEALLQLFRNRPQLAPLLLRDALQRPLPNFIEARVESADLSDIQPAEYRADLVVLLLDAQAVFGVVVEVQLQRDEAKRYAWPAYVANLRARHKCPVSLLVITTDDSVARWAATPIEIGDGFNFIPRVLSPIAVPQITDPSVAQQDPELAVFSAMTHGLRVDTQRSVEIAVAAIAASAGLDADRAALYVDLVLNSLNTVARQALLAMKPANYEYQSEFARHYFFQGKEAGRAEGKIEGKAEGEAEGKAELLIRLITVKFGPLPQDLAARIRGAASAELDRIGERLLSATTLAEIFS